MARRAKRLLALLLALMMCVSLLPTTAFAEGEDESAGTIRLAEEPEADGEGGAIAPAPEKSDPEALPPAADEIQDILASGECGDALNWSLTEDGVLTITGTGDMWSFYTINPGWYEQKGSLRSAVIESGVTNVGNYAFYTCGALTSVTIPNTVTVINDGAFDLCSALTSVTIPESVMSIGMNGFSGCDALTSVTIPASVTSIGNAAFSWCGALEEIIFRGSAPTIGEGCFSGVTATVYYPSNREGWTEEILQDYGGTITWVPYEKEPAILASGECGDDLTWTLTDDYTLTITGTGNMWDFGYDSENGRGDTPWAEYTAQIRRLVISEGVTSIGWEAFDPCGSLTEVELPDTLITLGGYCFQGGAFTKIRLPASLERIYFGAFLDCRNLTDVYFDGTKAQWQQIEIYSDNSWLQRAMIHCSDGDIDNSDKCGDNLTWSFDEDTGTLTITGTGEMWNAPMPWDDVKAQITRVELPEGLTQIGDWAFQDCTALTGVEFPTSVTWIGGGAFSGCTALTGVVLPSGVDRINYYTFCHCQSLTSITIPANVIEIEYWAFGFCSGLTEISFEGSAPGIQEEAFMEVTATAYYPSNYKGWIEDVLQNYGGAITWVPYEKEIAVLAEGVCGDDLSWTLTDDGILTITGTGDMYDWEWGQAPWNQYRSMINTVQLPEGLTSIGNCAFTNCYALTDIAIPAGVTYIGYAAFYSCYNLPTITIPAGVTVINNDTFAYCTSLTSITIPASVTTIEYWVFASCSDLTEITFEGNAPTFQGDVFTGVTATAYYPSNYKGWTEDVLQDYSGEITWVPYEKEPAVLTGGKCGDDLTWTLMDDGTMTITGTGDMWDFSWSDELQSGDTPWAGYTALIRRLVVDQGATSIGSEAFDLCVSLTEVELPDTLVRIGEYAFESCAFTEIRLPASLERVDEGAFYDCAELTDVYYGGTITQWDQIAIDQYNDPLTRAAIHCTDGDVDQSNKCGRALTWRLDDATGTLTVSGTGDMWDFYNVAAPWAEQLDQIRKVVLETGVTSVGRSAFWGCPNLTEIVLPEGLTYLGQFCFRGCPGLTTVDLPASLEIMDQGEFSECPNLIAINAAPDGNYKTVDGVLFSADMKTLVVFPGGLNGLGGVYQVPDGVTTLGPRAFYGCAKLTEVKLPASVVEFGYNEFQRCYNLEAVNIPYGVQTLYVSTFYDCTSLKSLVIPASVTYITDYSFCNCTSLEEIRFEGSAPEIEWWSDGIGLFQNVTATAYYPANDESWTAQVRRSFGGNLTWVAYEPSGQCGDDLTWVLDETGVLTITGTGDMWDFGYGKAPWYVHRTDITSVVLPDGLTGIGEGAFGGCSSLTSIVIPEGVTEIKLDTFSDCTNLASVAIPVGVTSIGERAFSACRGLTDIKIPETVTKIGDWAFAFCSGLESITIPAGVTSIGWCAFYLVDLKEIHFQGSAPSFGDDVFFHFAATAYYPADDETWTEEVRQDYGGDITWIPCLDGKLVNPFGDVKEGKYYYFPVLWAYYGGITNGTSDTTFSPKDTCTRGQVVTFLWNAFGKPEPSSTENPFVDVKAGKYYTKAVLWAVENGITNGVDATHFDPSGPCTRGQVVTFLWKAYGKPAPSSTENPFVDVKAGKYYTQAVLWAVENGITSGTSATTFEPKNTCTRGQIVTFLYRYVEG